MRIATRLQKKTWENYHFIGAMPEWAKLRYDEIGKIKFNIEWFNIAGWEFLHI